MQLIADFETVNTTGLDLRVVGASVYARHPATEVLVLTLLSDFGYAWTWHPGDEEDELRELLAAPEVTLVSHGDFERYVWAAQMVGRYGFPELPIARWHDIMASAAVRGLPLKVEVAAKVLGSPPKDVEGSALVRKLGKNFLPLLTDRTIMDRVDRYNMNDDITELDIWQKVGGPLSAYERPIWELDQKIMARGVRIDTAFVRAGMKVLDMAATPLLREFAELTGGLRPGQRDKLLAWCEGQGVVLPNMQKATLGSILGPEGYSEEDEDDAGDTVYVPAELPLGVRRVLCIRQMLASASVKKLGRMLACTDADGRSRGITQYAGAHTQRWAGRLWQPQNFPRRQVPWTHNPEDLVAAIHRAAQTEDLDELWVCYTDPYKAVATALRHALIAEPGAELACGDYAGIELRVDLAVAGQHDLCDILASGVSLYPIIADQIYGLPRGTVTKKDVEKYTIGKNTVLGCGFQMGGDTFHDRYCPNMTPEFAHDVVRTYRTQTAPKVVQFWRDLEHASTRAVHEGIAYETHGMIFRMDGPWLRVDLPSASTMWYYGARPCYRAMPWDALDIRESWAFHCWKAGQWVKVDAYGGLICENLVQHLARCLLAEAMLRLDAHGYDLVLSIHDEAVSETRDRDFKAYKQIMEVVPGWAAEYRIPILVEGGIAPRYRKW